MNKENGTGTATKRLQLEFADALKIEGLKLATDNLAAIVYIMGDAYTNPDGAPAPENTQKALGVIGASLEGIGETIGQILNRIYGREIYEKEQA